MQISDRMQSIQPSVTLSINSKALSLKSQGINVISLAVGEPDFPTPAHVCAAAKQAIDENFCRYTQVAGIPELRRACGDYFAKVHHVAVAPESIIVGQGGKHCIYNFLQSFVNPGDDVLIPAPYWVSYPDMVRLAGGNPVIVHAGVAQNFKITTDQLDQARTPGTRLLIINSPSNPTGAVYTEQEYTDLIEWAVQNGIFVLADEIYEQLVFPPATTISAIRFLDRHPESVAVLNGLSKSFAMTGWRVGFLAGHPDLIRKMSSLQGQSTSNICSVSQKAALAALEGPMDCVFSMREAFQRRRDRGLEIIDSWPFAICPKPDGAFYFFVDVHACYNDTIRGSADLCTYLLDKVHVALVPGSAFGDDSCIRFSYAVSDEVLLRALDLVGTALAPLAR